MEVNLKIDFCSHELAKFACENFHYAKSTPVGKSVKIGVWEDKKFIGVVFFSRGATPNIGSPYKMTQMEVCELTRVALRNHTTPVSRILAIAIKMLKKQCPGLKLIVSYADVDQNHGGGIYKAGGWIFTGLMNEGSMGAFIVNGKKIHPKSIHSMGLKQSIDEVRKHLDPNATVFITKGKLKFIMPLNECVRKQIQHLSQEYMR